VQEINQLLMYLPDQHRRKNQPGYGTSTGQRCQGANKHLSKHYIPQLNGNTRNTRRFPKIGNDLERINKISVTTQTNRNRVEPSQRKGKILSIFRRTTPTVETGRRQPQRHADTGYHSSVQNHSGLNVVTAISEHRQI
jgi:hypothetical protein